MSGAVDVRIGEQRPWPDHVAVLRGAEVRCYSLREAKAARRVVSFGHDTEGTTGHCECSVCHGAVDYWDGFCKHCGVEFGEEE